MDSKSFTRLFKEERETHFYIDEVDNQWVCDTTILKDIRKLERQGWNKIEEKLYPDGTVMSARFQAPRNYLSPRKYVPDRPKRVMSPEHKEKVLMGLKNYRENKVKQK